MPVQPDSQNPNDVTELAAPVGENPQLNSLPVGEDLSPELGSNDTGDMGDLSGDMGGGLGGMPGEETPVPIEKTPEELLMERSEKRLLQELNQFFEKKVKKEFKDIKDLANIQEKVKNIKWNTDLIKDINNYLIEDKGWNLENLQSVVTTKFNDLHDFFNKYSKEQQESKNTSNIQNNPQQTQDLSDVGQNNNSKRSSLMSKVLIKDGTLTQVDSNSSKSALDNLTSAIRKTKASIKNLKDVKVKKAGIQALKASGKKFAEDFGMDMSMAEEPAKEDLAGAISELATAITDAMTIVEDLNVGMDAGELSDSDNLFDSAESAMGEGKELLEDADEDIKEEADEEGESFEEEKAEKEPAIKEKEEEEKSATIMKRIISKVADLKKEAEGKADPSTVGVSKDKVTIKVNKNDLEKGDVVPKDTTNTDERLYGNAELDAHKEPEKGITALGKGASDQSQEKTASEEKTEEIKIRKSVSAAVDKARLSVELAARQQLKGLIDNPLKQAFIKNMAEYGVEKSAAEAIAHNAFIDGFEESQKLVSKEAFETFMEKPYDDFVKVAEFTKNYAVKFAEEVEPKSEENMSEEKTASLRATPTDKNNDNPFIDFWKNVGKQRGYNS